jgi:hypothetical protein
MIKMKKDISVKDLELAFGWNLESETAFKQISLPRSLVRSVFKDVSENIRGVFRQGLSEPREESDVKTKPGKRARQT